MAVKKVVSKASKQDDDMFSLAAPVTSSKRYVPKASSANGPKGPMMGPSGPMGGPSGPMGGPSGPMFVKKKK